MNKTMCDNCGKEVDTIDLFKSYSLVCESNCYDFCSKECMKKKIKEVVFDEEVRN